MNLLADIEFERSSLAGALNQAGSPSSWHSVVATLVKPAREALFGFNWITGIEMQPTLQHGSIAGSCLGEMLANQDDLEQPEEKKSDGSLGRLNPLPEMLNRKSYLSTNKMRGKVPATKSAEQRPENYSDDRPRNKDVDNPVAPCNDPGEVYAQKKTARVASLQQWMNRGEKPAGKIPAVETPPGTETTQALEFIGKQDRHEPEKPNVPVSIKKQRQRQLAKELGRKSEQLQWQQDITHRIRKAIPGHDLARAKNSTQMSHRESDDGIWRSKISQQDALKQISSGALKEILARHRDSSSLQQITGSTKSTRDEPIGGVNATDADRKTLPQVQPTNSPAKSPLETANLKSMKAVSSQEASGQTKAGYNQGSSLPPAESPEFPPVRKVINDELRPSGKRTPLKGETEEVENTEFDEDVLADMMKRIIDEQARRQGIDV